MQTPGADPMDIANLIAIDTHTHLEGKRPGAAY